MNKHRNLFRIILFAIFVHIMLLVVVFDVYFSSPLDKGMKPVKSTEYPLARRLVLIVADGLYADAIFKDEENAPFLTRVRQKRGSWGVSHTRVPTESRPGHVAILGGIYEDPSAILKGWQANPVDFDSVINQSRNAWCWGSPDIINLFNRDDLSHIHMNSYDARMEDFGGKNTSLLDLWVFNKVKRFFECDDCDDIRVSKNIFFLHLLGIDTAGHGYKPFSRQYKDNIKFIDNKIAELEKQIKKTFQDPRTTFIVTSDHGMTDWGSHGAGSDQETRTPFIAWGAGIKIDNEQKDINQIDIAPLIATLIGINIPTNSIGKLPYSYLKGPDKYISDLMTSNVLQLLEIFNVKREKIKKNSLRFVPYSDLTDSYLNEKIDFFNELYKEKEYTRLIGELETFMDVLIEGLDYYHNYFKNSILISITIGFIGWICFLAFGNLYQNNIENEVNVHLEQKIHNLFYVLYLVPIIFVAILKMPFTYYLYFLFPFITIQYTCVKYFNVYNNVKAFLNFLPTLPGLLVSLIFIVGIILLVVGFFYKQLYSLVLFLFIFLFHITKLFHRRFGLTNDLVWWFNCLLLSGFPILPVMRTNFNSYVYISGYGLVVLKLYSLFSPISKNPYLARNSMTVLNIQKIIVLVAPIIPLAVEHELIDSSSPLKYLSWILTVAPILLIFLTRRIVYVRLTSIIAGFIPFYMLVSTNYELLFIICYLNVLIEWLRMELDLVSYENFDKKLLKVPFNISVEVERIYNIDNFRTAFVFISLIFLGFFGTGNIASLNSFDPMWVRCFLTVFSPFVMTGLILLKIIIPFIFTCCVFRAIISYCKRDTFDLFRIILIISDIIMLYFLYDIKNTGSWLEIGMSLSHFIIMDAFVIVVLILYVIAIVITSTVVT